MTIQKHVHKLKRHKYKSGNKVYFCILPDCHYKMDVALTLGKRTLCNSCGDEFIINEATIKLEKPHCNNCGKQKVKGADGKNYYIRKKSNQIIASLADDNLSDLRSRMQGLTGQSSEDDI